MSVFLGAYWDPRGRSAQERRCGQRLADCLAKLGALDELLSVWYDGTPIATDPDALEARIHASAEGGSPAIAWNGDLARQAIWEASCGPWRLIGPNQFLLSLPAVELAPGLHEPDAVRAMMRVVVACWEPEWAVWRSHELWGLQDSNSGGTIGGVEVGATTVKLGWMTYLSSLPAVSGLPEGVKLEPCGDGALVTIGCSPTRMTERLLSATRDALGTRVLGGWVSPTAEEIETRDQIGRRGLRAHFGLEPGELLIEDALERVRTSGGEVGLSDRLADILELPRVASCQLIAARVQALERRPPPRRADTCWLLAAAALYGDTLAEEFRGVEDDRLLVVGLETSEVAEELLEALHTYGVARSRALCEDLHMTDAELVHGEVFTDRDADSALKTHLASVPELIVYDAWQRGWLAR